MNRSQAERLHPIAILTSISQVGRGLAPAVILALVGSGESISLLAIALTATVLLAGSIAFGVLRWWQFQWWLDEDGLHIEKGIIFRKEVYIPARKVQTIDQTAGLFQRPFGLVGLKVKTGTSGTQADLSTLSQQTASRIRRHLRQADGEEVDRADDAPEEVTRLTARQLLLASTTSSQMGVILSGIVGLGFQFQELLGPDPATLVETYLTPWTRRFIQSPESLLASVVPIAAAVLVGLIVAWLVSIVGGIVRFGQFSVALEEDELIIRRGLLNRQEITIPRDRIQAIRIVEDILLQPVGYGTLYIESIGHADEQGRSAILHPCLPRAEWQPLLERAAPHFAVAPDLERSPPRALIRFLIRGLAPVILLVGIGWWFLADALWGLLLLAPAALLAYARWRDNAAGWTDEVAVIQSRRLQRVTAHVPHNRVQSATQQATIFQLRRDLAHASLVAASGKTGKTFTAHDLPLSHTDALLEWGTQRAEQLFRHSILPWLNHWLRRASQ